MKREEMPADIRKALAADPELLRIVADLVRLSLRRKRGAS